jgi:hypothetical protein
VRSCSAVLREDVDWQEALADWHLARTNEVRLEPGKRAISAAHVTVASRSH